MIVLRQDPPPELVAELARNLREKDWAELEKLGFPPDREKAVQLCASRSDIVVLASYKDRPAALFGLQLLLPIGWGVPWLLTTPVVEEAPLTYTRVARQLVAGFHHYAPTLIQWVDEDYDEAVRWMAGPLGFRRAPERDLCVGPAGQYKFLALLRRAS